MLTGLIKRALIKLVGVTIILMGLIGWGFLQNYWWLVLVGIVPIGWGEVGQSFIVLVLLGIGGRLFFRGAE